MTTEYHCPVEVTLEVIGGQWKVVILLHLMLLVVPGLLADEAVAIVEARKDDNGFLKVVVSFIDQTYPVRAEANGRLLLGFSKSGWGAWSLLLRQSDMFQRAVAWDVPLMMDKLGQYGSGDIFGTADGLRKRFKRCSGSRDRMRRTTRHPRPPKPGVLRWGEFAAQLEPVENAAIRLARLDRGMLTAQS